MSLKIIKKLADKKHRNETGLFFVEGEKNIKELLNSNFYIEEIFGIPPFLDSLIDAINVYDERMQARVELTETKQAELEYAGTFITNAFGIAVVRQKEMSDASAILVQAQKDIVIVLDNVRDPGNLGTIVRIADWFNVTHIAASLTTTDFYSPKVIAASMGSFTRISVTYLSLPNFLEEAKKLDIPIISADMEGQNIHEATFPKKGILLMGSESHGVSEESFAFTTLRVTIPRFGKAESLNVSVATGIILNELRRNK